MDPKNTNNQRAGSTGTGRQALFTPTPDADANSTNAPQQPINSAAPSQHFFSSRLPETGDIIIGGDSSVKTARNKRPFIIGGIIIAALVLVITVVIIASNGPSNQSKQIIAAEKDFNKYANYLLFEKDSDDALNGMYDQWEVYELDVQMESDDDGYWQKAADLLSSAVDTYDSAVPEDDELAQNIASSLQDYQGIFDFVRVYRKIEAPSGSLLLSNYTSGGVDGGLRYINNIYSELRSSDSDKSKEYVQIITKRYSATLQVYEIYKQNGCIARNSINTSCTERLRENDSEVQNLEESAITAAKDAEFFAENNISQLKDSCWTISDAIRQLAQGGDKK